MEQTRPNGSRAEGPPHEDPMDYEQDNQPDQQSPEQTRYAGVIHFVPLPPNGPTLSTVPPQETPGPEQSGYQTASQGRRQDPYPTTGHEQYDSRQRESQPKHIGGISKPPRDEKMHRSTEESSSGSILSGWFKSGSSEQEKQLARDKEDLSMKNAKLNRKNDALDRKNKDLTTRVRELEDLASARMTTISRQKTDINSLKIQLGQMTQEQQGMEDQIRTAQLAMSKKSSRPKIGLADEERTITGNFMNLHDQIRKWGKDWGGADFSVIESLDDEQKEKFLEQLSKVVALEDGQIPYVLRTSKMSTRSSVLCVSAMLGRYICAEVLEAPFRPLRPLLTPAQQTEGVPGDAVLKDVYHKLSDLNESRAQVWRSDMMSILDPTSIDNAPPAVLQAQEDAATRRMQAACDLTSAFLNESVGVLLPQIESEDVVTRDEQLQAIFQKAMDIAGRLWKQLTIVRCVYLEDLKHKIFSCESELMGAHAFHKLGLDDEEENRLDNHPIRIVVFPAVKGYGNSDGENYSQDRIWGKAIVWLDE
ncbi:hypothetical protein BDZ45DRAFT_214926 [Acephala macrosclerotiorum]|nr:hypothetical protein BDZ45DRAFT_214926 [Acephala macrosclerotiorum]